ncbi:DYL1 protein, partial [Cochlearius cochlearius]|nr:DYL1 protein [Cochlearius cochlearius]
MGDQTVVIKDTDMSEEMQQDVGACATQSLEECNAERDIAAHVKRISQFDRKSNPTWQCAVGRNFVTRKTSYFILVCLGPVTVLLKGA